MKESDLRDHLKVNLELIEDGLELVDDEFYLKNRIGCSGFVDILARDKQGRLVVIEIKISKHSEREAITELFKYIALLKQNMSLKDSEIRLFVISTDWRELQIPFAEFHAQTTYNTYGLKVEVDENAFPILIEQVELPILPVGRKLLPRHWLQVYRNKTDRDERSNEYAEKITDRGIKNFVIVHFHFDYIGFRQYGFYFAQQEENLELYKEILKSVSPERYEEICEYTADFSDDEDILNEFADAATDMIRVPGDEIEIGSPEKITGYLDKKLWVIDRINKYGIFEADIRLTDSQILTDLCGFTGSSYTWYIATVKLSDSSHLEEVLNGYDECLYHNDKWRQSIRDYIDYFKTKDINSTMHINIFNPENILESLYTWSKYRDSSYVPNFTLIIDDPVKKELEVFEGIISSRDVSPHSLDDIIREFFDGEPSNILLYAHLHSVLAMNRDIMDSLSLAYDVRYKLISQNESLNWREKPLVRGRRIKSAEMATPNLFDWMEQNKLIVSKISSIYEQYKINVFEFMS